MEVEVYVGGRRGGTMPYSSLPAFRLFCKQNGFRLKWDVKNKRIDLDSGLKGKTCALIFGKKSGDMQFERDILNKMQKFLANTGIEVMLREEKANFPKGKDVAIRFGVKEIRSAVKPKLILAHGEQGSRRALVESIHQELKHTGIICVMREWKVPRSAPHQLDIQLHMPEGTDSQIRKAVGERIAFYLSSGILRYFHAGLKMASLSYLPPHILHTLIKSFMVEPTEVREMREMKEPKGVMEQGEKDEDAEENKALPSLPEAPEPLEASARQPVQLQGPLHPPLQDEKRLEAEVFFDYTVLRSEIEKKPFLIMGNLYVKNTGTEILYSPVVCLRAVPADSIQLGGQILPPNLVETMAVQGSEGVKGWKYLEDNWFSQAKERGEYWIAPIQPVQIAPQETEPFQNFQISVLKPEAAGTVTIEGFVYFREQGLQFASNNRISLSF